MRVFVESELSGWIGYSGYILDACILDCSKKGYSRSVMALMLIMNTREVG